MRVLVTVVSLFFLGIQALNQWSYSGNWPTEMEWPEKYPSCGGQRQSPINLQRRKVRFNKSLMPLHMFNYEDKEVFSMTNNGHTVQITLPHTMHMSDSKGTKFIAEQMHLHWGGKFGELSGSEHTIDGVRFPMEIHLVHFNEKYGSFEKAKNQPDGLVVLAVFVKVEDYNENTYFSNLISELDNIRHPGQTTTLKNVNIRNMMPEEIHYYYTYRGSLTTPPCSENVRWFVFPEAIKLSKVQVMKIENSINDHNNETLQNGYRKTQPLHQRVVEANFPYFPDKYYPYKFFIKNIDKKLVQAF